MGIQNFHKWIKQTYPNARQTLHSSIKVEHVYIDLNFYLHNAVYNSKSLNNLFNRLYGIVINALSKVTPTKSITFASDGAAPYAKLILQRARRLIMLRNTKDAELENTEAITSLDFTPGTKFMINLEKSLKTFFERIQKKYPVQINKYLDGPGEAEMKLFNHMNQLLKENNNEQHIIFSNDADVMVIAMSNDNYDKINVVVKTQDYELVTTKKLIKEISKKYKQKQIL